MAENRDKISAQTDDMLEDQEWEALFAAFDDVSASEQLQSDTLHAIFEACESAQNDADGNTGPDPAEQRSRSDQAGNVAPSQVNGKARWRVIRTMAIAACLAFACFGGVAWATPAAEVRVETAEGSVELSVNRFERVIGTKAENENTQKLIDAAKVSNKSYEDSIDAILEALGEPAGENVKVEVDAHDEGMRDSMEDRGKKRIEEKGFAGKLEDGQAGDLVENGDADPAVIESIDMSGPSPAENATDEQRAEALPYNNGETVTMPANESVAAEPQRGFEGADPGADMQAVGTPVEREEHPSAEGNFFGGFAQGPGQDKGAQDQPGFGGAEGGAGQDGRPAR